MNKTVLCCLIISLAACGRVGEDTRAATEDAVKQADANWSKVAESRDLDATVSYYSDQATVLPPNAPAATDKAGIRAMWSGLLNPHTSVTWQVTKADAAQSGELAYVIGTYQIAAKDPEGKAMEDRGKLLEVWKKQADGKWKVDADIFNSDVPTPPAAPGK
jgi:ketosteroid isomerase-like protein